MKDLSKFEFRSQLLSTWVSAVVVLITVFLSDFWRNFLKAFSRSVIKSMLQAELKAVALSSVSQFAFPIEIQCWRSFGVAVQCKSGDNDSTRQMKLVHYVEDNFPFIDCMHIRPILLLPGKSSDVISVRRRLIFFYFRWMFATISALVYYAQ